MNISSLVQSSPLFSVWGLLQELGELAQRQGYRLYLVGGVVRDLLLGRPNLDLDLVVEGDALVLARHILEEKTGEGKFHPRFGTAKLTLPPWSLDLATARSESYPHPGALPRVRPGDISADLRRRDFTINAMALSLNSTSLGELLDPYGGRADMEARFIRILHPRSFIDDATRIFRALRYEQRLNLQLEATTEHLLRQNVSMLDTISGDRLRHELELILHEEAPGRVLRRAEELGVLRQLSPSLLADAELEEKLSLTSSLPVRLALFFHPLPAEEGKALIQRLHFSKALAQHLQHTLELKGKLPLLSSPLSATQVYELLQGYSPVAIEANLIAHPPARANLELFLKRLRYVKPALKGDDLIALGVPTGRAIGKALAWLREARLESEVRTKQQEVELVGGWLASGRLSVSEDEANH